MTEVASSNRSRFGRHVLMVGFNMALFAGVNPAMAHDGALPSGHSGPMAPVNYHLTGAGTGASGAWSHFGGTAQQGLIHPHSILQPVSASLPIGFVTPHILPVAQVANIGGTESVQLNLSSANKSVVVEVGVIANGSTETIVVGGKNVTVHTGQSVTPAELVAVYQVQSGAQTITLDKEGRAVGGNFSLNGVLNESGPVQINSIVVPQKVSALDYLSSNINLSLSGDLLNYGSIIDVSSGSKNVSANLSALDIVNEKSGLITSAGNGSGSGSESGSTDLNFTAVKDFTNLGLISSSGALSISAGGNLSNGAATNTNATINGVSKNTTIPSLSAVHDVSLQSANISNSGLVSSSTGNINLNASDSQSINVNNIGGTLSATAGAINLRGAAYSGAGNSNIVGGNLLSQQLNLNAGAGTINVNVDQLTGAVNSNGSAVHVQANTQDLILGAQNLTGDPTYYNSAGNITISGDINVAEDLAIIASGNINATSAFTQINTQDTSGNAHNVFIVAGANVQSVGNGGDTTTAVPSGQQASNPVGFTGSSTTGGDIDFSAASPNLLINTSVGSGTNTAGNITMAAFAAGATGGHILLPNASNLTAFSGDVATSGNITLLAGATGPGIAINVGHATIGGDSGAANIQILNVQPMVTGATNIIFLPNGSATGGQLVPDYSHVGGGDVVVNGLVNAAGALQIGAGGSVLINGVGIIGEQIGSNAAITVTAGQNISFTGQIFSAGAIALVAGGSVSTLPGAMSIATDGDPTIAYGDLTIVAGAAFSYNAQNGILITGASGLPSGRINFASNQLQTIETGDGERNSGNITLVSFENGSNVGINLGSTTVLNGASGSFQNGNFTAVGNFISTKGLVNNIGGESGTGNISFSYTNPNATADAPVTINADGSTTGSFAGGTLLNFAAGNTFGPLKIDGGSISIIQSAPFTVSSAIATGTADSISLQSQGSINITANPASGGFINLALQSGGDTTLNSTFFSQGSFSSLLVNSSGNINVDCDVAVNGPLSLNAGGVANLATGNIFSQGLLVSGGQSINMGSDIFSTSGIVFVSGGSITESNTSAEIRANKDIVMVAGALYSVNSDNTVNISGASGSSSSNIFAAGAAPASIFTPAGNGGLTLAAFANGSSAATGQIVLDSTTVASGNPFGTVSFVTLVSGFQGTGGILNNKSIDFSGDQFGSGDLTISYTQPNASVSSPVVINSQTGAVNSGTFLGGAIAPGGGGLPAATPNLNGGNYTLIQAQPVTINGTTFANGTINVVTIESAGDITVQSQIFANGVALLSGGNILLDSGATFQNMFSGLTLIASHDITTSATFSGAIDTSQANGAGGSINVVAGAVFNLTDNVISVTGSSATGGKIDLSQGIITKFSSQATSADGAGGDVLIYAYTGSDNSGYVKLSPGVNIFTSGITSNANNPQNNGNVEIRAGQNNGVGISVGTIDTSANTSALVVNVSQGFGTIDLEASTPLFSVANLLQITTNNGSVIQNGSTQFAGGAAMSVTANNLIANGSLVEVVSTHIVQINGINASAVAGTGISGGDVIVITAGQSSADQLVVGGTSGNFVTAINASGDSASARGHVDIANANGSVNTGGVQLLPNSVTNTGSYGGVLSISSGSVQGDVVNLTTNTAISLGGGASGNGGSIDISGYNVTWTGMANTPLILSANAGSGGMGGTIGYETAAPTALNLDGSSLQFSATGGGGFINVSSAGNLTYNPASSAIDLSAGQNATAHGGTLSLSAGYFDNTPVGPGTANLLVTGNLAENGTGNGAGGFITLQSNSVIPFTIGGAAGIANGVVGTVTLNGAGSGAGGTLVVQNVNGSISVNSPIVADGGLRLVAGGAAGNITLGASLSGKSKVVLIGGGSGSITETSSKATITAGTFQTGNDGVGTDSVTGSGSGSGSVGGKTPLVVNAANLSIGATVVTKNAFGGSVNITDTAATVTLADGSASTGNMTIAVPNGVLVTNQTTTNGALNLSANAITVNGNSNIEAVLSVVMTAKTGNITFVAGSNIDAASAVTLTAAKGSITIADIGDTVLPSTLTVTALNGITVLGTVASNQNVVLKTTATAAGMGTIQTGDEIISNNGSLTITAGNGDISSTNADASLNAAEAITLTATKGSVVGGSMFSTGSQGAISVTANNAVILQPAGSLEATNNITLKAGAGISLCQFIDSLSSTGSVSITTASGGIGTTILTAIIGASNNITLTAAKGDIFVANVGYNILQTPKTISLTALDSITGNNFAASNSVSLKTTAASSSLGLIEISGLVEALAPGVGVVSITSANTSAVAINVGGEVAGGKSVTVATAKGSAILGSIGDVSLVPATVSVTTGNSITVSADIFALNAVTLKASGTAASTGDVNVTGNVTASAPNVGVVTITSSSPDVSGIHLGGDVSATKSVTLTDAKGGITVNSAGNLLPIATLNISALSNIEVGGLANAVSSISLKTTSTANQAGIEIDGGLNTSAGSISVISAGTGQSGVGGLIVSDGASITASSQSAKTKATILLENSNTTSGNISLGAATIATSGAGGGNITVSVGAAKSVSGPNPNPVMGAIQVTGNSGQVFFGPTGTVDPSSTGSIIVQNANMIFSSASRVANSIIFTGTTFNPDPRLPFQPVRLSMFHRLLRHCQLRHCLLRYRLWWRCPLGHRL